jgi:hypothetical protein
MGNVENLRAEENFFCAVYIIPGLIGQNDLIIH